MMYDACSKICVDPNGVKIFRFLCMLIWPFLDVYWIACSSLSALQPDLLMDVCVCVCVCVCVYVCAYDVCVCVVYVCVCVRVYAVCVCM